MQTFRILVIKSHKGGPSPFAVQKNEKFHLTRMMNGTKILKKRNRLRFSIVNCLGG
jgi:hypothetical protein